MQCYVDSQSRKLWNAIILIPDRRKSRNFIILILDVESHIILLF